MTVTPTPPDTLREALADRYRLERQIGRGGMATVFLATDVKHHREVAVKVLRPEVAESLGAERFLREIDIAAQLNHPHILPLLDSAEVDGVLLYVMPYVDGESLRLRLEREGRLPLPEVVRLATEVAGALSYAHRRGVVHRDIKPENILLSEGHAVVADFGIAKALSSLGSRALTRTGFPVGTPGYMSPEQAAGVTDLDARSDVYSLACVVYEMLVGDVPRFWLSDDAVRAERLIDAPSEHRTRLDALPRPVERSLALALARQPQDRLASPTAFVAALTGQSESPRRRYSDTEVRDIVKRAAEDEARPTRDGVTLGGVQDLGAEVGLEADVVARAAKALDRVPSSKPVNPFLGSPESFQIRDVLPGRLRADDQVELLTVIREVMGQQGEVGEVMGSLEWRSRGGTDQVSVTVTPRQDTVGMTILANRSVTATLSYFLSMFFGVGAAAIVVDTVQPGASGMIAILGTGAAAGYAVGRTIFMTSGRALKRRLDRLRQAVGRFPQREDATPPA